MKYNPSKIERKWQKYWEAKKLYRANDTAGGKKNFMLLTEFAYPSGDLHVGHWLAFSVPDMLARYLRMEGNNVLYPTGFDAFGLPAENAAIQRNINPRDWTEQNIKYMTKQLKNMGAMFDWSREVRTIDIEYYKWTQWMFLKFYEKGLAYRGKTMVNWCPRDKTVLANEQVVDNCCDRCGTEVVRKELTQWMFKITKYADQLYDDLDKLDWPETTKLAQKNWIGRSSGSLIKFKVESLKLKVDDIEVFTTRPDTIYGVTFMVVSPELANRWLDGGWEANAEVNKYVKESLSKRELERQEAKEKTGVDTGLSAVNPINNEKIPVWVADYVLGGYGTGAIMAVPAHDERDREFAEKFGLPISDAPLEDAKKVVKLLEENGLGRKEKNYRLRDWILSRQRYWGVPIPMVNCTKCGYVPVEEKELPVKLPKLDDFKPSDDGRSPLAKAGKWLRVKCPKCGGSAERETDTMDTFVDSSWYFLRYTDPKNKKEFASKDKMSQWLPVPMYIGGAEHNTMHLLYSRFFTKALYDLGYVEFSEPFVGRRNHGIVLGPDGQKMSKSKGNVVDPDVEVGKYGADTVRMYLAFMGPYDNGGPWDPKGISGVYRFLNRIWYLVCSISYDKKPNQKESKELEIAINKAIKNITEDIKNLKFNTCVSELMKLTNTFEATVREGYYIPNAIYQILLRLLAPFAPHIAEELWMNVLGNKNSIHLEKWPDYDETLLGQESVQLVIQVNGKVRDTVQVKKGLSESEIKELVLGREKVKKYMEGREVKKFIYIQDRLTNIVI